MDSGCISASFWAASNKDLVVASFTCMAPGRDTEPPPETHAKLCDLTKALLIKKDGSVMSREHQAVLIVTYIPLPLEENPHTDTLTQPR